MTTEDLLGQLDDASRFEVQRDAAVVAARVGGLLDAAPDAMVLVDRDGRIVLVNGEAERLVGYERQELIGRPVEILVPERFRAGHPAHRSGYLADPRTRPMGVALAVRGATSSAQEEDRMESYSLGANAYVRKPVDFAHFLEAARTLGMFWFLLNEPPRGTAT